MLSSVRARLTLWYIFVFGLLLIGFSILIYILLSKSLYERLDHSLASAAQATATEFQSEIAENSGDPVAGAAETLRELQLPSVYTAIFDRERPLASNYPDGQPPPSREFLSAARSKSGISFETVAGFGEEGARLAVMPVRSGDREYFVTIAEPLHEMTEQIEVIRRIFYFGLPTTLLVAGIGGFLLAKKSLSPVVEMSDQAKHITATNLQERLKVRHPGDELGRLAGVFNEMLSRLEHSFENMRQFMADASHELRTPLSIIRGEADVSLSQDRNESEYKESLAIIQDEARRLSRIVDDMLALARADAGQHPVRALEFYLNDLVEEACRSMQVLAARKGVSLTFAPADDLPFQGDEDMLRRLILNLIDNAIKYTPAGGSVSVKTVATRSMVKIIVSDTGVGIAVEAASHIFERFYRVDTARSRADGGSGLGLAIARWVAEAHNGSIDLTTLPGSGSTFTVSLPRSV
jgi:two-component system, OmpR family, sensor kinase